MAVNLSPVGGVAAQFFTNTGAVLTGGKLYTYLAGTTTPATTYTTSAGNVAQTNPIVLDAAGRVSGSGEIWLTSNVIYKFLLKDSNDVLIGTYDNVSTQVNTDASLVTYTPAGTGAVTTTVQAKLRQTVSVQDFGATGDGTTNDTAAIQAAATSLASGGTLNFPVGTYVITAPITFSGKTNITLVGYGATIQCGATRIQSYFNIDGANGVNVLGFTFNAKMQSMPTYTSADYDNVYNCGVYTYTGAQNITIRDCSFVNLYTVAGFFRIATNVIVTDCQFTSPLQTQDQKLEHLLFQTSSAIKVTNCDFENAVNTSPATNACGIFASGIRNYTIVDNCTFNYCGRDNTGTHRLGVIDFYYDVDNVTVTNCVSKNTMASFMRLSTCDTGLITNNQIEMNANCQVGDNVLALISATEYAPTANTNCRNIVVSNNVFVNDSGVNIATCIGVFSYDWGAWSDNILIDSNVTNNFPRMVTVQGPFNGVKISNNQSVSTSGGLSAGRIQALQMPSMASAYGSQANSYFNNLDIVNNIISSRSSNGFIDIDLSAITTTAYVGVFKISNNVIDATLTLSPDIGINANLVSTIPSNTTLTVENNFVQRYNYGFQLRNCGNVVLSNNNSQKNTNYLIQSGNLTFNAYGNVTRNALLSGKSKLAAGTVTVLGSDCNTGDNIMVSHYDNTGASLGHLYLSNIGNGTFDINSTSATDVSNVIWQIIH